MIFKRLQIVDETVPLLDGFPRSPGRQDNAPRRIPAEFKSIKSDVQGYTNCDFEKLQTSRHRVSTIEKW